MDEPYENTETCDMKDGDVKQQTISVLKSGELQEKLEMVNVQSSSPTSLLARNTVLLPSGVMHANDWVSSTPNTSKLIPKPTLGSTLISNTTSAGSATGNPRNKTVLTPGHSLMDWIRLGNSGADLSGVGGVPRSVTLSELANHNKQTDAWIAIRGMVFNVTRYMDFHPGGIEELMKGVGKDATKIFENVHAWVNYQSILQKCVVGRLTRGSTASSSNISNASVTGKSVDVASHCSPTALDLIKSCTHLQRTINQDTLPNSTLSNITVDWKQTTNSITIFYKAIKNFVAVYYQLTRHNDSKLIFKVFLETDVIIHEVELTADVGWPPICRRNFETMEVSFIFTKNVREIWKTQGTRTLSRADNVNSRTYNEYEVIDNVCLNQTVHMLVLRAKDYLQLIPMGRYVEAKLNIMGMEVSRPYTPVPPCLHPGDTLSSYKSDCICLIIKRYPHGTMSPSITALQLGQFVTLSSGLGAFVVELYDCYSTIHMLAAGTGLTPMLGIIQRALGRRVVQTINLVNFNKSEDTMFYVSQLDKVCGEKKLIVTHVLSQPTESWKGKRGIVTDELLDDIVGKCSTDGCVFLCGPESFMKSAKISLEKLNWGSDQLYGFNG